MDRWLWEFRSRFSGLRFDPSCGVETRYMKLPSGSKFHEACLYEHIQVYTEKMIEKKRHTFAYINICLLKFKVFYFFLFLFQTTYIKKFARNYRPLINLVILYHPFEHFSRRRLTQSLNVTPYERFLFKDLFCPLKNRWCKRAWPVFGGLLTTITLKRFLMLPHSPDLAPNDILFPFFPFLFPKLSPWSLIFQSRRSCISDFPEGKTDL